MYEKYIGFGAQLIEYFGSRSPKLRPIRFAGMGCEMIVR